MFRLLLVDLGDGRTFIIFSAVRLGFRNMNTRVSHNKKLLKIKILKRADD